MEQLPNLEEGGFAGILVLMSGHSKWSKIKRQKGVTDQKRSNLFTKLARSITVAVKESGGTTDPSMNFKLRLAIEKAKAANMPKTNIDRAIASGEGGGEGEEMFSALYEGYGPGGVAVLVESISDNKQRAYQEVRQIFDRGGATLGQPGSVNYLFDHLGEIVASADEDVETKILQIMEVEGVEDVKSDEEDIIIYTLPNELAQVKSAIEGMDLKVSQAELVYRAKDALIVEEAVMEKVVNFIDKLEDSDEIQNVFVNADIK